MLYVQMELCERGTLRQIAPSLELDLPRAQPAAWKIVGHIGSALGTPRPRPSTTSASRLSQRRHASTLNGDIPPQRRHPTPSLAPPHGPLPTRLPPPSLVLSAARARRFCRSAASI